MNIQNKICNISFLKSPVSFVSTNFTFRYFNSILIELNNCLLLIYNIWQKVSILGYIYMQMQHWFVMNICLDWEIWYRENQNVSSQWHLLALRSALCKNIFQLYVNTLYFFIKHLCIQIITVFNLQLIEEDLYFKFISKIKKVTYQAPLSKNIRSGF